MNFRSPSFSQLEYSSATFSEEESEWDWLLLIPGETVVPRQSKALSVLKNLRELTIEFLETVYDIVFSGYQRLFSNLVPLKANF
ncbi:hypothetical protein Gasu2_05230 [Galdieria sulphuraria]|uniref:Uncharacterized protein n=1 Tax=Galdieria sulphuraria TaxID=130081 RepID=M2XQB5_GALSU|nr:uncharacterized protein Gasu_05030 [Galdieria sulphuraria]EME32417.1 hypothetical protein Gasu_05030 [Galdieria sulphuraria]GJD06088.1 hypothetical protein Gasu2_05230 [Galdieria sulphuraria]|eukprot:XP_005708937.1 hypothetical protein Gasu_05030 [Galdieria sulphuraria]